MPKSSVSFTLLRKVRIDPDDRGWLRAGTFAKVTQKKDGSWSVKDWYTCREYFQNNSHGLKRMLFVHKENVGANVAAFIHRIEELLDISQRTTFGPTQFPKIMWLNVSPWWTKGSMRRSLFSALLRAGQNYDPERRNFEEALWSNRYTRQSKYATRRFLRGFTKYTGNIEGWNNQFFWGGAYDRPDPPSKSEVNKLLVKPN